MGFLIACGLIVFGRWLRRQSKREMQRQSQLASDGKPYGIRSRPR